MNKMVLMVAGAMVAATVSTIVGIVSIVKSKSVAQKIEKSVNDLEKMSSEDIKDEIIRSAVEKSADKKVDRYMADTEDAVLRTARKDLEIQARNAVVNSANEIRDSASAEIARQVAQLDIEQLRKRVCDQAEKQVLTKFDGCLDSSLKKFQDQLDNTRKIYDGIARAMAEKEKEKAKAADRSDGFGFDGIVFF